MSDELTNATRIAALEDYNARLLAENVRLSNEAATERERCGVLEREVRAGRFFKRWRSMPGGYDQSEAREHWEASIKETDTRHALDAAKFVGGGK